MKRCRLFLFVTTLCLSLVQLTLAQTSNETASTLPRLVRFGGTVRDLTGSPLTGVAGITFALYSEQTGGAALWMETQNVTADSNGRYTALLGCTKSEGLPTELFNSEQARWVGVQVQGQAEQPRVLLVSAPYALKAGDAETIGGLPPSAFVLAAPPSSGPAAASGRAGVAAGSRDVSPAAATDVTTTGGTANYLPFFTGASTILDSVVYQTGTGSTARIGINTSAPATTLDVKGSGTIRGALSLPAAGVATATAGANSEPLNLAASVFNSGTGTAVSQTFQLKAEPVGNDTAAASGALSLLYGSGTSAPAATGLKIARNGVIGFAAGQTFPGAGGGTVTSVGSGAGLTGGPITGSGSLSIATGGVSNAMLANPSLTVTAGADLTGGGAVTLGGSTTLSLDTTKVPLLSAANTFSTNQTVNGTLTVEGGQTGVHGQANGGSVVGQGPPTAGVWGDAGGFGGYAGVLGTADDNLAGGFVNNSNYYATLSVENDSPFVNSEVLTVWAGSSQTSAVIADPGCNIGFIALQLGQGGMGHCNNYTLAGGDNGHTYMNAVTGAAVHLRVNSVDELVVTSGNTDILGTLTKPAGSFKIDHPLDPANKYLYHSFVESPDMKNMYDGNVTTDEAGLATVRLPDWFETLNRDFRYQLTVIGQFAQAIVSSEIGGNQFSIRTDKPNVKVSWQVTGTRQDAFANAHRIQVEVEKAPADRGHYLYPELVGAPDTARIGYMAPAPGSEQVVHHRPAILRGNASPSQPKPPSIPLPPMPAAPKVASLPRPAAQASKLEVNQK